MSLFIGRLPPDVKVTDLENVFQRYGKITRLDVKRGASFNFAFVEYDERRDAEDALKETNGSELPDFNVKLVVEWAKGGSKQTGDSTGCFKCGREGHWARDCPQGGSDRRRGSPRRRRSRSRSPPRRRSRSRDDRRDYYDKDRDYDRRDDRDRDRDYDKRDDRDRDYDRRDDRDDRRR